MMNEAQFRAVEQFIHQRDNVGLQLYSQQLEKFVKSELRAAFKDLASYQLLLVVCLVKVAPIKSRRSNKKQAIPVEHFEQINELLQDELDNDASRFKKTQDYAVAYGCGKWRTLPNTGNGLKGIWHEAKKILIEKILSPHTKFVLKNLKKKHISFEFGSKYVIETYLAESLIKPFSRSIELKKHQAIKIECHFKDFDAQKPLLERVCLDYPVQPPLKQTLHVGQRMFFNITQGILNFSDINIEQQINVNCYDKEVSLNKKRFADDRLISAIEESILLQWACSCGHSDCDIQHRLSAWKLESKSLSHLAEATVKGGKLYESERIKFQTKQFSESSLFYAILSQFYGLRIAKTLYKVCQTPDCNQREYLQEYCPDCQQRSLILIARDALILPNVFMPIHLYYCNPKKPKLGCNKAYPKGKNHDGLCPNCHKKSSPRPTLFWLYKGYEVNSDELDKTAGSDDIEFEDISDNAHYFEDGQNEIGDGYDA